LPTRQILGKDNEAVASGPIFSEIPCPLLRALHYCLVKKILYHSRATEALKQVICFSKYSRNYGKMCQWSSFQVSSCKTLQNFVPFVCILCSWI